MTLAIRALSLLVVSLLFFSNVSAQFYPDTSASWCLLWHWATPDTYDIVRQMDNSADTVILGQTYKRMDEFTTETGSWGLSKTFYVRSASDGKGYVFLPDSSTEYLTGDTAALAGDTVHDVLCWYDIYDGYCGSHAFEFVLVDVVVDSVVFRSNAGETIRRHYVQIPCDNSIPFAPHWFFWQAGIGTSFGPFLHIGNFSGAVEQPLCASVAGVTQFYSDFDNLGLPGGPTCCFQLSSGMNGLATEGPIEIHGDQGTGLFELSGPLASRLLVFDMQGRLCFTGSEPRIDLRGHPPGVYTVLVTTARSEQALRLVLLH